jgi:hypothetical protein
MKIDEVIARLREALVELLLIDQEDGTYDLQRIIERLQDVILILQLQR